MLGPLLALAMMQKQTPSAEFLFNICQSSLRITESSKPDPKDFAGGNYCVGYIEGFMEGSGTMKRGACVPESTDIEPLVRAYVAYLIKHPEDEQLEKRGSVVRAGRRRPLSC